jgi:hypothetical protein
LNEVDVPQQLRQSMHISNTDAAAAPGRPFSWRIACEAASCTIDGP